MEPSRTRWALTTVGILLPLFARAQTMDATVVATRRAMLEDAADARTRGDHARALQLSLGAGRIEMTASVAYFIAGEQQALGQLGHAFASAQRCSTLAENNASTPNRATVLTACRALTDTLRAEIGMVSLHLVAAPTPDLRIRVNGEDVAQPGSSPVPVQPGAVVVEAFVGPQLRAHREITATAGQSTTVDVELSPTALPEPSTPAPVRVAVVPAPTPPPVRPTPTPAPVRPTPTPAPVPESRPSTPPTRTSSGIGPGPFIVAGAGAVIMLTAIPFYAVRQNALGQCTPAGGSGALNCTSSEYNNANTFNTLTNVAWIGGAVVLVGGATWLLVAALTNHPSRSETHARRTFVPSVTVRPEGGAMLGVGGEL